MALDITTILDTVQTHVLTSGYFDTVNGHEPKSSPGNGLSAAVWVEQIGPARGGSGLAATSTRLALCVRLYTPMVQEPEDAIDPNLMTALDALMAAYSADFTLGEIVREVDLQGIYGDPLSARAGYLTTAGAEYRVMTITLPLIVNDLWEQAA
ncbi:MULTISPECIES: hypothetical protein [Streptomyces]|uniref:Uncharacterized protein n=1 Tax=Streptomyces misionensis TaxID=67331 RepID=A0A1H4PB49_9ACTN|nr:MULTISPECIES: hypothetical protein [Streptomyces]SEC04663.1 hypothetical protein SAMN04490357_1044 [Streptomyces misionensis]SFY52047.1 hypothetical protein STEPF1_05316 [Streptomyces sp. F-1]